MDYFELAECYLIAGEIDPVKLILQDSKDHKPFTLLNTIWVIFQRRLADQSMVSFFIK